MRLAKISKFVKEISSYPTENQVIDLLSFLLDSNFGIIRSGT